MANDGVRVFRSGSCYKDGKQERCVVFRSECHSQLNETFRSDYDTLLSNDQPCDGNAMGTGRCLLEQTCATRFTDCATNPTESNFRQPDPYCTFQRDKLRPWDVAHPEFTPFGSCHNQLTNEYFCIFHPSDCDESRVEVYLTPTATSNAGVTCDCSEVHVTACRSHPLGHPAARSFCAVDPDGCAEGHLAVSPHQQRVHRQTGVDGMDCRLCGRVDTEEPTSWPSGYYVPTPTPTVAPTEMPVERLKPMVPVIDSTSGVDVIVAVSIGSFVGLVMLVCFSWAWKNRDGKEYDTGLPC